MEESQRGEMGGGGVRRATCTYSVCDVCERASELHECVCRV